MTCCLDVEFPLTPSWGRSQYPPCLPTPLLALACGAPSCLPGPSPGLAAPPSKDLEMKSWALEAAGDVGREGEAELPHAQIWFRYRFPWHRATGLATGCAI